MRGNGTSLAGILVMVLLVITAVGAGVGGAGWKRDLRVGAIRTEGNRIVTAADILGSAGIHKGEKLLGLDLQAARARVLANHFIKDASVTREVPDRILISITERSPVAAIVAEKMLYLDDEGYVLPAARSEHIFDLPILTGTLPAGECTPGKQVKAENVRDALALLATARRMSDDLYRRISEVHVEGEKDIVFYTSEFGVPVIFGRGDCGDKLAKFEAFWQEFASRRGPQNLHSVDLRFTDQVVARWNQ